MRRAVRRFIITVSLFLVSLGCILAQPICDLLDTNDVCFGFCFAALVAGTLGLFACMRSSQISECERRTRGFD